MREFALLEHVFRHNSALPADVLIPPGDDMGAIRVGDRMLLVTVDQVADGVHVNLEAHGPEATARKAITRNLSDVAAMAARPRAAVAAACLPRSMDEPTARRLFDALHATASRYDCPLIGGDVSVWDQRLLLTVTILAEPWPGIPPVLRRGARAGDVVCVTGELGGSLAGHHLRFEPRIEAARELAALGATSMIDLSDGLARDLGHLCRQSDVGAVIEAARLPIRGDVTGPDPWLAAVGDGEDYELCVTMPPGRVPDKAGGVKVTPIGQIVESPRGGAVLQWPDGACRALDNLGWEHHSD